MDNRLRRCSVGILSRQSKADSMKASRRTRTKTLASLLSDGTSWRHKAMRSSNGRSAYRNRSRARPCISSSSTRQSATLHQAWQDPSKSARKRPATSLGNSGRCQANRGATMAKSRRRRRPAERRSTKVPSKSSTTTRSFAERMPTPSSQCKETPGSQATPMALSPLSARNSGNLKPETCTATDKRVSNVANPKLAARTRPSGKTRCTTREGS
mmetsp:Transcript_118948/g.341757  ORF Transcript_118948/g.341757 Transcript_118948/m.341757 type:complete len:213 (+) Transcript_118948:1170-1808(+)